MRVFCTSSGPFYIFHRLISSTASTKSLDSGAQFPPIIVEPVVNYPAPQTHLSEILMLIIDGIHRWSACKVLGLSEEIFAQNLGVARHDDGRHSCRADPFTAIKYQIAIMIAIFSGTAVTVFLPIRLTFANSFNAYSILHPDILRNH